MGAAPVEGSAWGPPESGGAPPAPPDAPPSAPELPGGVTTAMGSDVLPAPAVASAAGEGSIPDPRLRDSSVPRPSSSGRRSPGGDAAVPGG